MSSTRPIHAWICFVAASFLIGSTMCRAESGDQVTDEDLLLARNPLLIRSRVRVADEYTDLAGGGSSDKLILAGVWGFGFNGRDRDFGIGFELPYLFNNPSGSHGESGVGDLKLRCGQLWVDDPKGWRSGWFFETEFDTAADEVQAIANQRNQMAIGTGAGYALSDKLVLTSTLQYGWSLDDGATNGSKREWEAHVTVSSKVWDSLAINLDYKAVVNTVGDTELFSTLEPSIGWTFGAKKDIGLAASCEVPLYESGTNWIAKLGITRFF